MELDRYPASARSQPDLVAALVPEGAVAAAAAFVDRDGPPGPGLGNDDGCRAAPRRRR